MMNIQVLAQVVGQAFDANVMLFRIKERLQLVGMSVKHPYENRLSLREFAGHTYDPRRWTEYDITLDLYKMMQKSSFHVISNDTGGLVDGVMTRSVLYAMALGKPIVFTNKPYFAQDIPAQWRQIIQQRSNQIIVVSLLKFNNEDLQTFVKEVSKKTVDYALTKDEKRLIKSCIEDHLKDLFQKRR
ncbi:MAG TPA: hypothetical protein VFT87_00020 [Candidatus Saccharimonadales bacterium]|nr:hypothetical protein [Candidatus Saccharimonadales bacterium]